MWLIMLLKLLCCMSGSSRDWRVMYERMDCQMFLVVIYFPLPRSVPSFGHRSDVFNDEAKVAPWVLRGWDGNWLGL